MPTLLLAATLPVAAPVFAQTRAPNTGNPEATLPQVSVPQTAPQISVQIEKPTNPALQQLLSKQITPTAIRIEGVKSIPFSEVSQRFAVLANHPVTIGQLIDTANSITQLYQQRGYALSFCFVPAQDFANGVVRITVVEGYVNDVKITGDAGNAENRIRSIANHIAQDRPLRLDTFQRYINVLGQLPGVKIAANVPPPQNTDGATQLQLAVTRQRISGGFALSSNQPGVQGLLNATENGLLGLGEQLSVSALEPRGPQHQTYYAASYSQPVNSDGLTLRVDVSHFEGQTVANPGLPGFITQTVRQDKEGASLAYPFILSNNRTLVGTVSGYASYNDDNLQNTQTGAEIDLRSQTRVLQTQLDYADSTSTQVRKLNVTLAKAFNVLGASEQFSTNIAGETGTNPADLNFFRAGATYTQTNSWPWHLGTSVSVTGQFSPESLPTSEQITFGAQRYALGYEPGEAAGDSGWAAALELNRSFPIGLTYLKTLTFYIAYDMARVYLHNGQATPSRLDSIALGTRLADGRFYSVDVSIGKPVGDAPIESPSRNPRVNLTLSYQLN